MSEGRRIDAQTEVEEETIKGLEREIEERQAERSKQATEDEVKRIEDNLKKT